MKIRIKNARVLTPGGLISGEIRTDGAYIVYVGSESPAHGFTREIDAGGNLVLPGFKNAHTHSAMTFLRSLADDLPLHRWLNELVFPMEAKLEKDDIYHLTRLAILEYLSGGVTAAFDMYFQPEQIARAAADCGFRMVLCDPLNSFGGSLAQQEENFLRFNNYSELVSYRLGFHGEYTTSEELLRGVAALSHKYGAGVHTHFCETADEVSGCVERHGCRPAAYLDSLGLFDHGGALFHCVHLTDGDMDILARRGMWAVTCPASNCKLASGVAPLVHMSQRGVPLAVGTDGPASNNCLDMFREMYLATALQKVTLGDASALPAGQVLSMAVSGGAHALGLPECDSLAPGKRADLVMLDLRRPNMQPENDLVRSVVYSGGKQNVALTMINGRILYENGSFYIGADPDEIYRRANAIVAAKR